MIEQSFVKALFFGVIADELIFPFPEVKSSERPRLRARLEQLQRLLEDVDPEAQDASASVALDAIERLAAEGFLGLTIPESHGGAGFSTFAGARIFQQVAAIHPSLALTLLVHEALGARAIAAHGTDAQKDHFLPRLATGECICGFALTERTAGSDAGTIRTYARPDPAGGYRLSGEKFWVTNGGIANLFLVIARTSEPDRGDKPRLTALLVEQGPGISVGARHQTLGMRGASITPVTFDDVAVPPENVLGEPRKGMKVAMAVFADARLFLAAAMVGQTKTLIEAAIARLRARRSFGRSIGEFAIMKEKTAAMLMDGYAIESMTYLAAGLCDRGIEDVSLESSIARLASAEALWRGANHMLQIAGSAGYEQSEPFERMLRDARAGFLIDGTHEILRCFIALAGMQGPGRQMEQVERAMHEPVKGFGLLRDFAVRKVRGAFRRERMALAHPLLAREAVEFEQATEALAAVVERALREHGLEIAEMQHTQRRIADISVDLFALAAAISRTSRAIERDGESGASRHIDVTTAFATAASARMARNLQRFEHNDDPLRDVIAARGYADGGYPFDVL